MRRWRVEEYREYDRLLNARNTGVTFTAVGSKGEGLTSLFESDFDMLYVLNDVLCVEAGINLDAIPDDIDVLRMDTRVYPGHCRKFHEGPVNNCREDICSALCDNGYGDVLLSSGLFLDSRSTFYNKVISLINEPAGPSIPLSFTLIAQDTVLSLPCLCPSIVTTLSLPQHPTKMGCQTPTLAVLSHSSESRFIGSLCNPDRISGK
ncbi:hypothetical protein DPMN_040281 [Dreissena polymorpha]|uniref:Uncharacterized protein n=1 Tax=Dreissena polymorpha TaxID=45954 RepID=A0A9D4CWE2_DREPO|nr:hypothetical protein DPMN_040281 [Dreissena polymorpha]